ncbi:MAG: glycosyltransferase [Saprospiraceae bacterium]|nr:glycosyltransferase [Pyrinomonadaceae bacterium]
MKILRIIARLNVGGPARHVVWLTDELQDAEFQSVLVAGTVPDGEEDMSYLAGERGVKPVYIEEMSRELSLKDAISLFKIYRQMKRERPDIVHTHTAKAGTVGRSAAFLYRWMTWKTLAGHPRRVRIVHTFHGHVFHSYYGNLKTKIFLAIEKTLARFATDTIITISPQQRKEIADDFRVGKAGQFEIIPLGIDLEPFAAPETVRTALRREVNVGDDELLIGFIGRLTEIKNVSLLLKVAELYKNSNADLPRLQFVITGDGHLRQSLEDEAEELGIGGIVTFLGNRTDTQIVYAGLDVIALTSFNEGTPLSLIEAMASKRPVISTAVGGVADLLGEVEEKHDGFDVCERGISVADRSAASFFNGLMYLAKNEKLREHLSTSGYEFVQSKYSKERLVSDIKSLYRRLMQ